MVGIWLLAAEHLRQGTWDLLCAWSGCGAGRVEPRLAMQLVDESALCVSRVRKGQSLSQKGFEVASGLPFVATDQAMHALLKSQTVRRTEQLQIDLGRLRRASAHYSSRLLAVDPHHLRSWSKRQMRRHRHKETQKPFNL